MHTVCLNLNTITSTGMIEDKEKEGNVTAAHCSLTERRFTRDRTAFQLFYKDRLQNNTIFLFSFFSKELKQNQMI